MKKLTLVNLGVLTFSVLVLGAQSAQASVEEPAAKSDATVLFEANTDTEEPPVVIPPIDGGDGDGGGVVDPGGSDGNSGDGTPSFNITYVSNFRFNETQTPGDFTGFKPIKLNANGMKLWAKGTQLKLNLLNEDGTLTDPLETRTYSNIPNFVQVTDNRGKNSGWILSATAGEFTGENNETLAGAELTLNQPSVKGPAGITAPTPFGTQLTLNGNAQNLMTAGVNAGTGTWSLKFGNEEKVGSSTYETLVKDTGVSLTIPASAQAKADVAYKAELNWVLKDAPAN